MQTATNDERDDVRACRVDIGRAGYEGDLVEDARSALQTAMERFCVVSDAGESTGHRHELEFEWGNPLHRFERSLTPEVRCIEVGPPDRGDEITRGNEHVWGPDGGPANDPNRPFRVRPGPPR